MNEQEQPRRRRRRLYRTSADWFGLATVALLMICSLVLLVQLMSTKLLTDLYLIVIEVVLLLINAGHVIIQLPIRRVKTSKVVCGLLAVLLSGLMLYGSVAAASGRSALLAIAGHTLQKTTSYVVVMDDDPARSIGDTVGYTFGILSEDADISADNTQALLDDIKDGLGGRVDTSTYTDLTSLADALYDGNAGAIILNSSYLTTLDSLEDYSTFSKDTRIIYEFSTTKEVEPIKPNASITSEPFIVYCSGIDARSSDISITSRSDVNILAAVNPVTKRVALVNTPRDYYVDLAGTSSKDKLTHAGLYGVETSMETLGNLYGVNVDHYIRINFAGFISIIDALGGVDVYSDQAFTSVGSPGYYDPTTFVEGWNHLDGKSALAFARERHAFASGDIQRGINQMKVIDAMLNKIKSPALLMGFSKIMDAASDCFVTSFSQDQISALVRMQLSDFAEWDIESYTVTGTSSSSTKCYSAKGQKLYVMKPDDSSVSKAREMLASVLGGEGTVADTTQKPEKTEVFTPTTDPNAAVSEVPAESVPEEVPAESVPEETVPADQPADAEQPADTQTPEPEAPAEGETGGDTPAEAPSISLPTQEEVEQAASSIYNAASSIWGAIQDAASQQNDAA